MPLQDQDKHWTLVDMAPLKPALNILLALYGLGSLNQRSRLPAFKIIELDGLESAGVKQRVVVADGFCPARAQR